MLMKGKGVVQKSSKLQEAAARLLQAMKEGLSSDSMDSEDDVPSEAMLRESLRKGKPIFRIVHRPFY